MAMPSLTNGELVGLNASGRRVLSTASLTQRIYDRALWQAVVKPTIHWSYADGVDCPTVSAGLAFTVSEADVRTEWTIGRALVPGVGNETGIVRLYVRQHSYTSGTLRAGLRVRRAPLNDGFVRAPDGWVEVGSTFSLGSSNGWRSGTFTIPQDIADGPFEAWVYLTTTASKGSTGSSTTKAVAWSLCSDGAAWTRTIPEELGAHFRRQSGPPDDVFTLRLLRDYQADVAALPTVLAHHSFLPATGVGANWIARYVIPAPLTDADITIHAYCRTTGGAAASLNATCATTDITAGAGDGLPAADDTQAFSSATLAWRTATVTPVSGSTNYLTVWVDPDAADTAELLAVYATQAAPADGDLTTGAPGLRLLPLGRRDAVPGAAIVNSYSGELGGEAPNGAESIQNLWTDRFATMNNSKWWPQTRGCVTVPGDWCRSGVTYTNAFDSTSPVFGVQTKIQPRWGASGAIVAARVTTDDIPLEDDAQLAWRARIDGALLNGPDFAITPGSVVLDQYRQFGNGTIDAATLAVGEVFAGFTDLAGNPTASVVPARIEGVAVWEEPPLSPANSVHFRGYAQPAAAIPDNDAVTGVSSTIVCARGFIVGYVRAHVVVSHTVNASQMRLTLSDGTTTRRLAAAGDLSGTGSYLVFSFSDAYEDDTVPDQALSAFRGSTSAATWTLTAYDEVAGGVASLESWALELW